ncbi:MAG: metalloregulator ArsR/SmtB family transcription factor [Candidatus Bathyarchaeia archaeon]
MDYQLESSAKERLERLISSSLCSAKDASKHIAELRELAREKDEGLVEQQSRLFKALSDPLRLKILRLLTRRRMCVCEVMAAFGLTQPTASHHLGILERAGLIKSEREGKWVFFKLENKKTFEAIEDLYSRICPKKDYDSHSN